jgi:hypothetical protein
MKKAMILSILFYACILSTSDAQKNAQYCNNLSAYNQADAGADFQKFFSFYRKSKLYYLLANDQDWLYVKIIAADEPSQKKILAFGATLWIDETGGSKQKLGIEFPFIEHDQKQKPPRKGRNDFEVEKFNMLQKLTFAQLVGFSGKKSETLAPLELADSHRLSISIDQTGKLIQEFKLSLKKFYPKFDSSADQELSIGFVTGNLDKSQMPAPPSGQGGGASRPPQDIDMQEIQEMSYPAKLWIKKIHLNVNQ